jgi:hypothetical protein
MDFWVLRAPCCHGHGLDQVASTREKTVDPVSFISGWLCACLGFGFARRRNDDL